MATKRLSLKYGAAAVIVALAIIGTSLYANTALNPTSMTTQTGQTSFLVMLTDPPNVPRGTTQLNVTYSSIQLHVVASDGSSNWVAAQESGRVNLLSLVNMTQTIATLSLPTGSTVDKLQFEISAAEAKVSDKVYPVTMLSDNLLVSLRETKLNGTKTGALIDLRPTLVQINAMNSTGSLVSYFVLSPSATAIVKSNVLDTQTQVGAKWRIGDDDNNKLSQEYRRASNNITVTSSSLSVKGNVTTLSVTIKNIGKANATISSITLSGDFNVTSTIAGYGQQNGKDKSGKPGMGGMPWGFMGMDRPDSIPFKISGDTLTPIFGDMNPMGDWGTSRLVLKPGNSATLTFNGVISLHVDGRDKSPKVAVTPVKGNSYTIHLMSEGFKTFKVTAS
ncbi:MAG: DUF4382 domain-containing protein [Candidatus Bathyarchaeia archaeon]|jgi:hypothetical protein